MSNYNELKELSAQTSVATVCDVMPAGAYQPIILGLQSVTPDRRLFGQAVTVRSLPARPDCIEHTKKEYADKTPGGDPMMYALKLCGPGKVLVVDAGGINSAAVGGDTKFAALEASKAEGVVTDGALRDQREFREMFNFSTYCGGFTPLVGTGRVLFPHDVNVDINCGGALVRPDDFIFGDEDGVVVLPAATVEKTLNDAVAYEKQALYVRAKAIAENSTYGDIVAVAETWMPDFLANAGLTDKQKEFFA